MEHAYADIINVHTHSFGHPEGQRPDARSTRSLKKKKKSELDFK
jgi:hypothetical protein